MADPVLSVGSYALAVGWIVVVAAVLAITWQLVARTLGRPCGAVGAVAGTVAALGQLTLTGQLLGAIGQLRAVPFAAAMAVEGAAVWQLLRRRPEPATMAAREPEPHAGGHPERDRVGTVTAMAAVALVGLQWITHTVDALDRGMTHPDTLWYHAPYSARFLQMGSLGDLGQLGYAQSRYFPLGSELLHAEAALPFHRDLLSPLVNLVFFALALAAALTIGARWRAAPAAVLSVVAILGLPTMAGTQPGQASNDVVVAALLLSSVALVLHASGRAPWFGVAGLALGLAMGAKVTVVVVAGVMVVGFAIDAARAASRAAIRWWLAGAALPVLAWPIRNLVVAGSPLPFFDVHLGPVQWDAVTDRGGPSFLEDLLHDEPLGGTAGWGLLSGVRLGLGRLWPLVLMLLLGGVLAVVRGPRPLRPAAVAAAVGGLGFTLLPNTGGSSFQFNLRYLTPALVLAAVTTAAWVGPHRLARQIVTALLAAVVGVNLFAAHHERVDAWPLPAPLTIALALAAAGIALVVRRSDAIPFRRVAVAAAVVAVGAGWIVQEHHLRHRYVAIGLHDDVLHAAFREVSGAEVHVLGSPEAYPFFGADLSNVVVDHSDALVHGATAPDDACRYWRTQLRDADRIVISEFGFIQRRFSAEERQAVFAADVAVTTLLDDGARAIYRVDGDLDPSACPPAGAG